MNKKILLITLFLLIFSFVYANTPIPDYLCAKVIYSSDKFHFLVAGSGQSHVVTYDEFECADIPRLFERTNHLYYEDSATKLRVILNNDELINADLDEVSTTTLLESDTDTKNVTVYMCPWRQKPKAAAECPILLDFYKHTNNISIYDNSTLKIFMDDTLVREYLMEFHKGDISYGNTDSEKIYYILVIIASMLFFFGIIFIFIKSKLRK